MPSIINATTSTGLVSSADNSGSLQLATNNGTTAVTIDTSQNVGIGTSSPSSYGKLGVVSGVSYFGVASDAFTSAKFGPRPNNDGVVTILHEYGGNNSGAYWKTDASSGSFSLYRIGTVVAEWDSSSNFKFNSGYGSAATAYGCRAWVNFVGTGTPAINASGNVSSIGDIGVGHYSVNFSNAFPDSNYTAFNTSDISGWTSGRNQVAGFGTGGYQCRFWNSSGTETDPPLVVCAAIR